MAADLALAFDLGTGGCKASLYDVEGRCWGAHFAPYETRYPRPNWHEQRPRDWWDAVVLSARALMRSSGAESAAVRCIGLSGFSLGMVSLDRRGGLALEWVPIWSDSRPGDAELSAFFGEVEEEAWYARTGNGFPPGLYTVFKMMWLRGSNPELFSGIDRVLGSKDYINFLLTGVIATDFSYASGSGVYDLVDWAYSADLVAAAGMPLALFPEILPSTQVLGTLSRDAATALGLSLDVQVVAGGVDNSCMALGAGNLDDGSVYNSLGSSSWIAVTSRAPLIDFKRRPYVFAHVIPGLFNSATAIFSAGSSHKWMVRELCRDLSREVVGDLSREVAGDELYARVDELAGSAPIGSKGLLFNPSLAGGSSLDASPKIRGAYIGLTLEHGRADVVRSTFEGISLGLADALDVLSSLTKVKGEMTLVGGGAKSAFWRQMLADVYGQTVRKTAIDEQAAALGAAALSLVGSGYWNGFERISELHEEVEKSEPDPAATLAYRRLLPLFRKAGEFLSYYGETIESIRRSSDRD
ncbi:MAG: FGGY family carbohydrate kinase [Spirochaetaceae bacterium]|nr:FGGY family carbohydrate kinase [Spirochaetaceae bacterium]